MTLLSEANIPETQASEERAVAQQAPPEASMPRQASRQLATGAAALGMGVLVERGLGFLANTLAARLGGTGTFGAYSLALTTAGNISTYAAGGIGATAARFSGKYPYRSAGYPTLLRALLLVSVASAAAAGCGLWLGAAPLAHLLHKASLTPLLRWAALSAAAIILLECARGFFVGQRRIRALLLLCSAVGVGMVALLPLLAAHHQPAVMIAAQAAVACAAVALCVALGRPLGLHNPAGHGATLPLRPVLGEVWRFGGVQLAGLVGMNLAGWWLTTLVARDDTTLLQMSFLAVANQLRNIVGLGPGLLTESSYSIMAAADPEAPGSPDRIFAFCAFVSTLVAFGLAGCGILAVPWLLHLLYGNAYADAGVVVATGFAVAVVHMGNAPAAARLTIVSLKSTGVINTVWALLVASVGTAVLLRGGNAAEGMAVLFGAHLVSATLVLGALYWRRSLPRGVLTVFAVGSLAALLMTALSVLRATHPADTLPLSLAMVGLFALAMGLLGALGRRRRWLPGYRTTVRLVREAARRLTLRGVHA